MPGAGCVARPTASAVSTEHDLTVVVVTLADRHPAVELRPRHRGEPGTGEADSEESGAADPPARSLTGVGEFDRRYLIFAESAALVTSRVIDATLERLLPAWMVRGDMLIIPWPDTSGSVSPDYRYTRLPDARTAGTLDARTADAVALAGLLEGPERADARLSPGPGQ